MHSFFSYLCCCFKKQNQHQINIEQEQNYLILKQPLLTDSMKTSSLRANAHLKKITTAVFVRTKASSISKVNLYGADFVIDKNENPANFYEKVSELGEGAFGKVFKVKKFGTSFIRALKVMNQSETDKEDILKEGELLKNLSHPNIIKIFEVYHYGKSIYLIEEFVNGGDLYSKISKLDHLFETTSLAIMKQIFSAVCYLHQNGLIHGDLKLENIMVESLNIRKKATQVLSNDSEYNQIDIKLIDFGCSTLFKDKKLTDLIGTIYYLAPEVILGSYDNKCDIWSCGVILYILLTGKFPFYADKTNELFDKILDGNVIFDKEEFKYVSQDTINLIKRCLTKDPTKRISAYEAMAHKAFDKINSKSTRNKSAIDSQLFNWNFNEALSNIKNLNKKIVFQKAVIKYITYNLLNDSEEVNKIRSLYKLFDDNNDGFLSFEELCQGLKLVGLVVNEDELKQYVSSLDYNNSGIIEYEDFVTLFIDKTKVLEERNLKEAFELFDIDKNGRISIEEIKSIFKLNTKIDEKMSEDIIKQLDIKSQHEITFEEFTDLMKKAY